MALEEYKNKVFLERPEVKEEYEGIKEEIIYKDRNEDEQYEVSAYEEWEWQS